MTYHKLGLLVGVVFIVYGGFIMNRNIQEISDHIKKKAEYRKNGQLYIWYLEWPGVLLDTLLLNFPNGVVSFIVLLIGLAVFVGTVIRMVNG